MASKLAEASEHFKTAEKYLRTGMTRWKADHDAAADEFNQAAQCYRIARELMKSKQCYIKASECYLKNKSLFHAAKALENALIVCKGASPPEEIARLANEASSLYQQHGSGDSAAAVLDKAGKILEEESPDMAYILFQKAADVSATESSQHQGSEYISKASRILVKLQRYDQALDSLRREIGYHQESNNIGAVGRLTVAIVLVQLARGDTVAAEKAYKEWGSNCEMAEIQTLEQLLQAYDEEDRESAKRALASPFIRNMDVEYARLAARVPLPEGFDPAPRAAVRENAAPSYVSSTAQDITTVEMEQIRRAQSCTSQPQQSSPAHMVSAAAAPGSASASADGSSSAAAMEAGRLQDWVTNLNMESDSPSQAPLCSFAGMVIEDEEELC